MNLSVDVRKVLRSRGREFRLDVQFSSSADFLVILGPSGSGKSLTLQAVAGLIRPDEGVVRFAGRTLFDSAKRINVPARKRQASYVFQDYALFPHMTVFGNIS